MNREYIVNTVNENLTKLDPAIRELVLTAVEGVCNLYEIRLAGKDAIIAAIQKEIISNEWRENA